MKVICYFDGGCEPINPGGEGTYGAIVRDEEGKALLYMGDTIGRGPSISNNVAEYAGIIAVMQFLIKNRLQEGVIYGDSQMVVYQLNRKWKARRGLYMERFKEAIRLRDQLPNIKIEWIPRERNGEADALARDAVTSNHSERHLNELAQLIRSQRADQKRDRRQRLKKFSG